MQRVCFCKTVSLFNHVLQPSQAIALFYQSLIFSLKNLALIRWISSTIDIPTGLQLLMIDINGNVTIDDELLYKQLSNLKHDVEQQQQQQTDTISILKWISRIVLRLASDCSISSKSDRSIDFESFNDFLKQFHTCSNDDRSTLSDDDEGISHDDLDNEDISRRAIHRALMKCMNYITSFSVTDSSNSNEHKSNTSEMQNFESNSIALYNQQIIQILCSDTLELEIELAHDFRQSSFELSATPPPPLPHDTRFYSVWASLWRDVTAEYLQFNDKTQLRKVTLDNYGNINNSINENRQWSNRENDRVLDEISKGQQNLRKTNKFHRQKEYNKHVCLHDSLMSEIKQQRILKPIANLSITSSTSLDSSRKRIRPVKEINGRNLSSDDDDDDEQRDEYGRKRVAVIDCLLESSPSSPEDNIENESTIKSNRVSENRDEYIDLTLDALTLINDTTKSLSTKFNYTQIEPLELEYISMEEIIRLMKDSSNTLSLTFDEFSHIRNVITRSELETLLFNEKLYSEVAQGKLCFTCRKVHFNLLTFTFGIQCNVCKQKVCRNCVTQIALPKEKLNNIPIQTFTPLAFSKSLSNSDRSYSLDNKSPVTPVMNDVVDDSTLDEPESRRSSTPAGIINRSNLTKCQADPIDICTDCFILLQQIRKKARQRHINPPILPSTSSSFNRSHHSSSRSTSNYNLSSSSSTSSVAALLAQQNTLMTKSNSIQSNLKQVKSIQEVPKNNDPLQTLTTIGATGGSQRVSLSRHHLFLKLQPAYDVKLNNIKTG
ncbi:unnamed protein product [Adineta steineri]|uniref:Uncharacterized protein n=1 Tax=Adineta steineri TaxID=433720 RepID=A0A818L913_9BILA|nr:unnamed protein product [Adineta steineri]CAF1215277.1 unnamed protein product [Adineta steineri]CAF3564965.1 unnamed protein product [Adineta steineri]CAF3718917.1 unnamed protein product [Adineta steineri]